MMNISALVSALPDAPNAMVLAFIGLVHRPPVPLDPHNACSQYRRPYDAQWVAIKPVNMYRTMASPKDTADAVLKRAWYFAVEVHIETILKNFNNKKLGEIKDIFKHLFDSVEFQAQRSCFMFNSHKNFMDCLEGHLHVAKNRREHILITLLASQKPSPKKTPKAKTPKAKTDNSMFAKCYRCRCQLIEDAGARPAEEVMCADCQNTLFRQNSVCAVRVLAVAEDDEDVPIGLLMKKK